MRSEEALRATVANCRGRCRTSASRQACPRRNDGEVARHHSGSTQLFRPGCYRTNPARSKVARVDCRHRAANMHVTQIRQVREPHAIVQRPEPAVVTSTPSTPTYPAEATAVSTPPRMEPVARTEREPAESAPTAKSGAEAKAAAPSPERYVRRSPERTVPAVSRTRPPSPATIIPEPTAVVIWRPAPRLVADPSPTVVRLVYPVAVAIGSPVSRLVGIPDVAVVVDVALKK